jgi:hypothetical protein
MLWTDQQFVKAADLDALEPRLTQATEDSSKVDAEAVIVHTIDMLGQEIEPLLRSYGGAYDSSGLGDNHMRAVMNTGRGYPARAVFLEQIIVDDPDRNTVNSALLAWAQARCIIAVYVAASARVEDDRWSQRADEWRVIAGERWRTLAKEIPAVRNPLPAPGSWRLKDPGSFSAADIVVEAGGTDWPADTYSAAITWTGAGYTSAAVRGNSESAPCEAVKFTLTLNQKATFSIESLNTPPPVNQGVERRIIPWMGATGWNLYVGTSATDLRLQNASQIPVATTSLELLAFDPAGAKVQRGQSPDGVVCVERTSGLG